MGKITGFLDYKRQDFKIQGVTQRISHYHEFAVPIGETDIAIQAARCMDCGIPFCQSTFGCPLWNLIPEWNDLAYRGQWREAYERLEITNNFPEFTGRLCPAPCESACTLSINDAPVTIKQIELAIIEKAFQEGWVVPYPPQKSTGKSVAVIGSGPAGLAAAQQLRRLGHQVTVFEKSPKIGGLLRYGIPDFKLEKRVIDRRLEQLISEGIVFKTEVMIGEDISAHYLKKSFDSILIATGAGHPRDLQIPGRNLKGIYFAQEFLTNSNLFVDGMIDGNQLISCQDKTVLVIGGGDTGSDCVGTANRQGARRVFQFEILPKPEEWKYKWNPYWPNRPDILRTSTSHQEGCEREWSVMTKSFSGRHGKIEKASFSRVRWDRSGKSLQPDMQEIPDSDFELNIDMVLLATGFVHLVHNRLIKDLRLQFDDKKNLRVDEHFMTSVPGVFAAGDAAKGPSLIVKAIYAGREAAKSIHNYLMC